MKVKVGAKVFHTSQEFFKYAKGKNKNLYGNQQAMEYFKSKGHSVKFFNSKTQRWNKF